jgi:hypothetical protein
MPSYSLVKLKRGENVLATSVHYVSWSLLIYMLIKNGYLHKKAMNRKIILLWNYYGYAG